MREITVTLRNQVGLHARPAALFVHKAKSFKSAITVGKDGRAVDAKSILSVLTLGAEAGDAITISSNGEDETQAIEALQQLVESNFGEPGAAT